MTIQMRAAWGGFEAGAVTSSFGATEESRLIAAGLARDYTPGMDGRNPVLSNAEQIANQALVSGAGIPPVVVPGAANVPRGVLAIAGDASAILIVQPTRSRAATSLRVVASSGQVVTQAITDQSPATVAVLGLTNGVAVTFSVFAINIDGTSVAAVSNAVTPTARPAHLAGLPVMFWLDASQVTPQTDNTVIGTVNDFSGNGYAATSSGTARPVYRTAANVGGGATGRPAIVFDGNNSTGQRLLTGLRSSDLGPEATIFCVAGKGGTANGVGLNLNNVRDQRLLSFEMTRQDKSFSICLSDSTGSGGNDCFAVRGGSGEVNATSAITAGADATGSGAPYILSVVTGAQLFLNGTRQAPQGAGVALIPQRALQMCIGNIQANQGSAGMAGPVWEVIVIRGRITDAQRWAIEAALATKYAQTAPAQQATI